MNDKELTPLPMMAPDQTLTPTPGLGASPEDDAPC